LFAIFYKGQNKKEKEEDEDWSVERERMKERMNE